jgi:hypothetical protein
MSTAALEHFVPVLVCATPSAATGPVVVLANGSYATEHDRVFWGDNPHDEVLRLPLSVPVTVRPVRRSHADSSQPTQPAGLRALADAVRHARTTSEQLVPAVTSNRAARHCGPATRSPATPSRPCWPSGAVPPRSTRR